MATKELTDLTQVATPTRDDHLLDRQVLTDKRITLGQVEDFIAGQTDCLKSGAGAVIASDKSHSPNNAEAVLGSLRTKGGGSSYRLSGGYSASGITVPAVVVIVADPNGAPTSGGAYTGPPLGTADPTYRIKIASGNSFQWRREEGGIDQTGYSTVTITPGSPQTLDQGVTVTFAVGTGWTVGEWTITIDDSPMTANRTWEIQSDTGDILISGSLTSSHTFTDYAEFFENASPGVIPLGTIVSHTEGRVHPARQGDEILGVVSAGAIIRGGDTPFHWRGRYLLDIWGQPLLDERTGAPIENPDYDPLRENVPRSERPAEWTLVGLLGQIPTRVGVQVRPGDFVAATGLKSDIPTRLQCLRILQPFDKRIKHAVALCLIR